MRCFFSSSRNICVMIFFFLFLQNIHNGYSSETPCWCESDEYHNICTCICACAEIGKVCVWIHLCHLDLWTSPPRHPPPPHPPPHVSDMDSSISELRHTHCGKSGFQSKINNKMANNADPDETAHYESSHLDLHCLGRYLYWSDYETCNNLFITYDLILFSSYIVTYIFYCFV